MANLATFAIYFLLLFMTMVLANIDSDRPSNTLAINLKEYRVGGKLAVILLAVVCGFRYNVGNDWVGYKEHFEAIRLSNLGFFDQYMEVGFFTINKVVGKLGLSSEWMFFFVSLFTWMFFVKGVHRNILPMFMFFVFVDEYFFWGMNGVRQFMAMGAWMFAIKFLVSRESVKFVLAIFLASTFHYSSLLMLPIYLIPFEKYKSNFIWIILFVLTLFIGGSGVVISVVESVLIWLGEQHPVLGTYTRYIESGKFAIDQSVTIGLGFFFKTLVNLLIILLAPFVIHKRKAYKVYFVLFFIGAVIFNVSFNIQLLGRLNHYFLILRPLLLGIIVYEFWQKEKLRVVILLFCGLYLLLFMKAIADSSNMCSPFKFSFFQ